MFRRINLSTLIFITIRWQNHEIFFIPARLPVEMDILDVFLLTAFAPPPSIFEGCLNHDAVVASSDFIFVIDELGRCLWSHYQEVG